MRRVSGMEPPEGPESPVHRADLSTPFKALKVVVGPSTMPAPSSKTPSTPYPQIRVDDILV